MIRKNVVLLSFFIHFIAVAAFPQESKEFIFEDLGQPIKMDLPIELVTNDNETGPMAWAGLTDAERSALVGIHMESGKLTQIDLTPYGKANSVLIIKHSERVLYLFAGVKGRFLKYDIPTGKLSTIGEPGIATYWVSGSFTVAPDGKIYVGTYPQGAVSVLDPATEKVEHINRISPSKGIEYIIKPASDTNGIVYLPMGMHHGELWSYNPQTKEKKQLLPKNLQTYGTPSVWRAADGRVYGKKGSTLFLCSADGIEVGPTQPAFQKVDRTVNGKTAIHIDAKGNLVLEDEQKKQHFVNSTFVASAKLVFSISDIHDGKLYGSSMKPGHMFSYDLKTGNLTNMGKVARGSTQVYDLLSHGQGMFISSYTGGYIEYFEPHLPRSANNPRLLIHLHRRDKQERPVQLTLASDGKIYSPTAPIKGHLGGALVQIDPVTMKTFTFRHENLIRNQSYTSVTPVPETDEIFVTSSISGGSSAKPTEKEAWVFLWDTKAQKISYKAQPISGTTAYSKAVRAPNGNIYGFSRDKFYVFNPVKREIVHMGEIKGHDESARVSVVVSEQAGSNGLLYIVDVVSGNLIAIDPSDNSVRVLAQHDSLKRTRFAEVKADGYMYYPNGSTLMRVRVIP